MARLLGPIISGMLFGAFGLTPILIISILCFTSSAIMEIFIHIPFEKPILIKIIGLIAIFNLVLSAMLIVGTPILIVETLQMSDELLGLSQGALALGGLCGGIFTAVFSKKLKLTNSHILLFLCGLSVGVMAIPLLLGLSNVVCYLVITTASFVIMGLATMFSVQMIAVVQTETPPELVGKVIALRYCLQPLHSCQKEHLKVWMLNKISF